MQIAPTVGVLVRGNVFRAVFSIMSWLQGQVNSPFRHNKYSPPSHPNMETDQVSTTYFEFLHSNTNWTVIINHNLVTVYCVCFMHINVVTK